MEMICHSSLLELPLVRMVHVAIVFCFFLSNIHWTILVSTLLIAFVVSEKATIRKTIESMKRNRRIAVKRIKLIGIRNTFFDFVKIRCVGWILNFWYVWCFQLTQICIKIDALEKWMRFDFVGISTETPIRR